MVFPSGCKQFTGITYIFLDLIVLWLHHDQGEDSLFIAYPIACEPSEEESGDVIHMVVVVWVCLSTIGKMDGCALPFLGS
jgi:hypothetical protein